MGVAWHGGSSALPYETPAGCKVVQLEASEYKALCEAVGMVQVVLLLPVGSG